MVPVGTRLLFCVLYKLRDSNNWLTYCKTWQFLFWCCTLLFLCGRNLLVFLCIVFNTVLFVCYCYSVLWPQISNKYLLTNKGCKMCCFGKHRPLQIFNFNSQCLYCRTHYKNNDQQSQIIQQIKKKSVPFIHLQPNMLTKYRMLQNISSL